MVTNTSKHNNVKFKNNIVYKLTILLILKILEVWLKKKLLLDLGLVDLIIQYFKIIFLRKTLLKSFFDDIYISIEIMS